MSAPVYNFAYLDEQTKRMIRRAILKAIAIPGYQVPFASREMPMPYGWGTGGVQVTAAILGPDDVLKVIDQGSDDTTNAVSIRNTVWAESPACCAGCPCNVNTCVAYSTKCFRISAILASSLM